MTIDIRLNAIICDAVRSRHLLGYRIVSTQESRIVEPHAYGVMHDGRDCLWSWNPAARGIDPNAPGAWELAPLNEIADVCALTETFLAPRPSYKRANAQMRKIYCQL
jgi:hypothetical protein